MNMEEVIIRVYCCIEEKLNGLQEKYRLRTRGFAPKLTDTEVITMEIVGQIAHQNCAARVYEYFKSHWQSWFPALGSRSVFMKQTTNLCQVKQMVMSMIFPPASDFHIIDGLPLPICKLARSRRCRSLQDFADYGFCAAKNEHYYGLKAHIAIDTQGLITFCTLTPANLDERDVLPNLFGEITGILLADKGYISAEKQAELYKNNIDLQTLKRKNMPDNRPETVTKFISKTRKIIETVFSILTEAFDVHRIKARSIYSFASKLSSKLLAANFYSLLKS